MTHYNRDGPVIVASKNSLDVALAPASATGGKRVVPSASPKSPQLSDESTCYGKVDDLEAMVPAEWWTQVFSDSMYLKTDGDVVEDAEVTRQEIGILERDAEIKNIFLRGSDQKSKPARILDLCCGQGRHTLHLAKTYPNLLCHGHDQSKYLISVGKERAAQENVPNAPVYTVGDCRQIPYKDQTFDFVMLMGNSFGYFKAEDGDRRVLEEIFRVLAPDGRVVLDLTDGGYMRENFAERSWEWIDDTTFVCRERQLSGDKLRLSSREVITVTDRGVVRDQFYQERLYSREELNELVTDVGLQVVPVDQHKHIGPATEKIVSNEGEMTVADQLSKRQEDLGMMGHRMIITAFKPDASKPLEVVKHQHLESSSISVSRVPTPLKPHTFESLILCMGDPSQPCIGKLNNTWNPEDFVTRDKLYAALGALGYTPDKNLTIIDTHSTLHETMKKLPKDKTHFVFNLCDEGFDNDALKELHVPAILEMIGLPYSGAGPNCLAFCYDKGLVNRTADALGVPTPRETFFLSDIQTPAVSTIAKLDKVIKEDIKYPAFIKPIKGDNSLGITPRSIVNNVTELENYMKELNGIGIRDVIIQEYCRGTEYGVGVIGNLATGFHFFPILEVDYSKITARNLAPILGFESKWDPTSPYWSEISYKPAKICDKVKAELQQWCIVLWERFGCRDYARFDFRCDYGRGDGFEQPGERHGTIKLLEVNPNPGWCWDGKFAYMGSFENKDYKDVLGMILKAAHDRVALEEQKSTSSQHQK
ncbi:UNVERIFIED_CONTAM: hypothetical protein HDU68_003962 [Siphonaria sp. JEL0065]|nr:hypothetical protein HDU68_003962 [Siphonaria sp. JEL0065]